MDAGWRARAVSPADVVRHVRSKSNVFVQGAAATPLALLDALAARTDIADVRLWHLHTEGSARFEERCNEENRREYEPDNSLFYDKHII